MKKIIILTSLLIFLALGAFSLPTKKMVAYGECSSYGAMSYYDSFSDSCKCMSGYVFGTGILGKPYCVSADLVCYDKLGAMSHYNSLSNSCECSYGYVIGSDSIGRNQCISRDTQCQNQLGYNSNYNILKDACTCRSGYVIDGGACRDGDMVCRNKHGLYSEYNSYSNKCECDSGYTFDDNDQCVKKQNNAYFYLKELDTDNRQALIKSQYDYAYYKISYGIGCLSSSFQRYLNKDIVVNLGTDYSLDTWDKIVLQDDNEVCNITNVNKVTSSTTLTTEDLTLFTPVTPIYSITAHPAGTNIKSSDGTISMIAVDGTKRPYTSAGAFLSYGFNSWTKIVDANQADNALSKGSFIPPRDGKIICSDRGVDKGTCYLVTSGKKAGFTSAKVFTGLGFNFKNTSSGDMSWMESTTNIDNTQSAHLPGVLIKNNGVYYIVAPTGLLAAPNTATLLSWGYTLTEALTANNADKALQQVGILKTKQAGELIPY